MKIYFILFLLFVFSAHGQAPLDKKFYLNNKRVSKAARDFYFGNFKATDDTKIISIIDSLKTKNNLTRPFYIYLVSKIVSKADGALSESLGVSCKDFLEIHPDFLIDFLYSKNKIVDTSFYDNWATQIAGEFMITCEAKGKECIKRSVQQTSAKARPDNKPRLAKFYNRIEIYCH